MSLATFLAGLFGGAVTYPALQFVFKELTENGVSLSRVQKRALAYLVSFILSFAGLFAASYFGYAVVTPDSVFTAFASAFAASQAFHMQDLDPKPT